MLRTEAFEKKALRSSPEGLFHLSCIPASKNKSEQLAAQTQRIRLRCGSSAICGATTSANPLQPIVAFFADRKRREYQHVLDKRIQFCGSGEFHDVPAAQLRLRALHSRTTSARRHFVHRCGGDPSPHSRFELRI